jgi:lipoyl(octanoyl) transferase
MRFERLVVYDDHARAGAATNMAIDEALLEQSDTPTIRFYCWARPSLSFGYFGKFSDVERESGARELVRRWTGGGMVPHGDDLTYALIVPASHSTFTCEPAAIYAWTHGAIRDALVTIGIRADLATAAREKISEACFANPVRDDVLIADRKIAGAAQRRTRRGFLQQGSVQIAHLSAEFRERLSATLSPNPEPREIPEQVRARAANLAGQKYATESWLRRR